jgi:hypothetical protein
MKAREPPLMAQQKRKWNCIKSVGKKIKKEKL